MAEGLSYSQIAERLVLSHRTVQNHVQNTLGKLQLHNRVELVRYAIAQGARRLSRAGRPAGCRWCSFAHRVGASRAELGIVGSCVMQ